MKCNELVLYRDIEEIRVNFENTLWLPPADLKEEIERKWKEKLREVEETNKELPENKKIVLYNGPLTRVRNMSYDNGLLLIDTQRTYYAYHIATRGNKDIERRANPLFAALVIELYNSWGDSFLVFGESLGTESEHRGKLNIVAGAVNPDIDRPDGYPSPGVTLQRELMEELGLTYEAFDGTIRPMFVVTEKEYPHPSIVYTGVLKMDIEELKERHQTRVEKDRGEGKTPEFGKIYFVPREYEAIKKEIKEGRFHNRVNIILSCLYHVGI